MLARIVFRNDKTDRLIEGVSRWERMDDKILIHHVSKEFGAGVTTLFVEAGNVASISIDNETIWEAPVTEQCPSA